MPMGTPSLTASACALRTAFLICRPLRLPRRESRSRSASVKWMSFGDVGLAVGAAAEVEGSGGDGALSVVVVDDSGVAAVVLSDDLASAVVVLSGWLRAWTREMKSWKMARRALKSSS